MTDVEDYDDDLKNLIDNISSHNKSRILWQRPKIEWLCFGQSSTYQAEEISVNDDLWFYSFNDHEVGDPVNDTSQFGPENPGVVYCNHSLHSRCWSLDQR